MRTRKIPPPADRKGRAALRICGRLSQAGFRALLAGGCVRDLILGVAPKDYDIATSATPADIKRLFRRTYSIGAAFGVETVVRREGHFEVAAFRSDGPYLDGRRPAFVSLADEREDAKRRDFTINALFFEPETSRVLDYAGGQEDIRARRIRTVGDPRKRFSEDRLRLLRAVRFAARLGFEIEEETFAALREMAPLATETSAERIRDELTKMLTEGAARRAFELLDASGLLEAVLPEALRMKGVAQPPEYHPEGDVFQHTLLMLEQMQKPHTALAWAALFHDAGKPLTQSFEDRIRFNNHDKVGAREAESVCRRLRMAKKLAARIVWLVENHMRLAAVPRMRESKRKRFVREPGFKDLMELCRLDVAASHKGMEDLEWVRAYLARISHETIHPAPLLRGRDLAAMGYAPGPLFSEILGAVEDGQLEGTIRSAEQARAFVATRWPRG